MKLIIEIPDGFYSDLKENRIDLGAIGCQLLLDKVKNGTPLEECEDAIKYFNTIHNLSQTCGLPYSFVDEKIEEIMKALKGLPKEPCTDAISRQAVIEVIRSMSNANPSYWNNCDVIDREYTLDEIEELPSVNPAEKVGQWIPVSERLPEENGSYFVTVKRGYVTTAIWVGTAEFWNEVTAWMPLPEPYKQEVEE